MTIVAWEHLVRDVLPRLEAEQQIRAATAAAVPHMEAEGRKETLNSWHQAAITTVRDVTKAAGSQLQRFRSFLHSVGINPETGQQGRS